MTNVMTIDEVKDQALRSLQSMGINADNVSVMYANAQALRNKGFLIDLDITGMAMFEVAVNWTLDLGIADSDARRATRRIRPGRKLLLPDNKLLSIMQRLRDNLSRYSNAVDVFPGYRYVPNSALSQWWERHQELVVEFDDYKAYLLDSWDELRDNCRQDFAKNARDTYPRLSPEIRRKMSMEEFVGAVTTAALAKFPSKQRITDELRVSMKPPATWLLESEYEQQMLLAEQIQRQRTEERMEHDFFARRERAEAERAEAEAQAAREKLAAEQELLQYEVTQQKEAIREIQLTIARDAVHDMVNPFLQAVQQNRNEILSSVTSLSEKIRKRGWVHGKEAEAIRNLRDWFALMDIGDDAVLADKLQNLANQVQASSTGSTSQYRYDADAVLDAMRDVISAATEQADELAERLDVNTFTMMDV